MQRTVSRQGGPFTHTTTVTRAARSVQSVKGTLDEILAMRSSEIPEFPAEFPTEDSGETKHQTQ